MKRRLRYYRILALGLALTGLCFCSVTSAAAQAQQAGEVQTGPITEPIGAEHKPSGPPIPKGIQAITQEDAKCSARLIVNANALFEPGRWTLNSDAGQTLDALGPMITRTGKHPVRIVAFTRSDDSDKNNLFVAEKRARTVRTWLKDRGLVADDTTTEGFGTVPPGAKQPKERVEVVVDTCKQPQLPNQNH